MNSTDKNAWKGHKFYSLEEFEKALPEAIKIIKYRDKGPIYYFYKTDILVISSIPYADGHLGISRVQDMEEVIRSHSRISHELYL